MGLFKIDGGLLVLDKEEIRGISCFKSLLERDKGSEGDHDGRKKYHAFKEFYYIYWVADLFSSGNKGGYPEKELHKQAIKEARLDENYKPDKLVKECIQYYREEQLSSLPSLGALNNLIKGIKLSEQISQKMINNIQAIIETGEERRQKQIENNEPIDIAQESIEAQGLIGLLDQLNKVAISVPKTLATLKDLQEQVTKEQGGSQFTRGGHKKGNRADPK